MAVDPNENYLITGEQLEDLGSRVASASAQIDINRIDTATLAVYEKIYTYTVPSDTSHKQTLTIPVEFADYDKIIFDFVGTATVDSSFCGLWTQQTDPGNQQETYQIGFEWDSQTPNSVYRSRNVIGSVYFSDVSQGLVDGWFNATFTIPDADGYVAFTCDGVGGQNGGLHAHRFIGRMKSVTAQDMHYMAFELPAVEAGAEVRVYGIPKYVAP